MQEIKQKRQIQLRHILDEIKIKPKNILAKKDVEKEINIAISLVND